ncbi:phage portal protein [Thermocatellispora tengchongensis]|uniref:phage portal protein n=1 Tax=Thermocatellispora tengchongensis TaxID=1073253 RepID=UPI00363D26B9
MGDPPPSQAGAAGAGVDLRATEVSLQKIAVWASVSLIAGTAGMLPLDAFDGTGTSTRQIDLPTWMEDPAGDGYGYGDWAYQVLASEMLRGNAVGIIAARGPRGLPTQIVMQHPDEIGVRRDPTTGEVEWRVAGTQIPTSDIWHQRAYPMPGRIQGLSPIGHHAATIGLGLNVLRFGNQFFEDGGHPTAILKTTASLNETAARVAKTRFLAAVSGRREPVVLGGDWEYQAIQIAPEESQFLETHKLTSIECCRIFGPGLAEVLGYETGGALTYQNIQERNIQLLIYALDPWLVRLERALSAMLPRGQYVRINRGALLRTDILTRYRAYQLAIRNRIQAPSEARELEDLPPLTPEQQAEFDSLPSPAPTSDSGGSRA